VLNYTQLMERFGDTKVHFVSYYKYSFCFTNADGKLEIYAGGDKDDIYRFEVKANKDYLVSELPISEVRWEGQWIYEAR